MSAHLLFPKLYGNLNLHPPHPLSNCNHVFYYFFFISALSRLAFWPSDIGEYADIGGVFGRVRFDFRRIILVYPACGLVADDKIVLKIVFLSFIGIQ